MARESHFSLGKFAIVGHHRPICGGRKEASICSQDSYRLL